MDSDKCCPRCGASEASRGDSPWRNFACGTSVWATPHPPDGVNNGDIHWTSTACKLAVAERERDAARAERDVARQGGARMANDMVILEAIREAAEERVAELEADVANYEAMKVGVSIRIADLEAEVSRLREWNERLVRVANQVINNFG
jgi:hypothetical protein